MRVRYASVAVALLLAAGLAALAAACTGSPGDAPPVATAPAPAAAPAGTATPAPATPPPAPTPSATPDAPTATPAPTATATPTPATATPTPATKRYNRLDPTGEAAVAGSWAILGAGGGVLTTWEALRSDAATLRLHQTDAGGASQAAAYGGVETGDIVEWRKADDCWVRYRVTAAPARPASGSSRWEFPVEWVTYAGAGCTGAVGASAAVSMQRNPPSLSWSAVTSPIWHGPYLLYPKNWTGTWPDTPSSIPGLVSISSTLQGSWPSDDPAVVRRHPLWREPSLPSGWILSQARAEADLVEAVYKKSTGYLAAELYVVRYDGSPRFIEALPGREARMINGHPAVIRAGGSIVNIFDERRGLLYGVYAHDPGISGDAEAAIAIAKSLLQ